MPAGRPTTYNEQTLVTTQEYIDSCNDLMANMGSQDKPYFKIKVNLPTIEGLSLKLDVNKDTIYTWRKVHPEFSDLIERLLAKQANSLLNSGLSGDYNPTISKVLLTKHGYREGVETTGKEGLPIEHKVDITKAMELTKQYEQALKEQL